jgi:hypothetical protein
MLHENHPELFDQAVCYEQEHKDGRKYTWTDGETLLELIARKDEIISDHQQAMEKEKALAPNKLLFEVLSSILDEEDDSSSCLVCNL